MEGESEAGPSTAPSARHKLSCDHCRVRKVGCNRENPCSSCHRLNVPCTYALGYKVRSKKNLKPATSSPTRLAERIDYIAERVDKLCIFLGDASHTPSLGEAAKTHASVASTPNDHHATAGESRGSGLHDDSEASPLSEEEAQYKGDSSLAAHADFTTRVLETALNDRLLLSQSQEVDSIMGTIRSTSRPTPSSSVEVQNIGPTTSSHQRLQLSLPPVQLTLQCLRILKENKLLKLFWSMSFESVGQVTEHLLSLYSVDGQSSMPELVITHIGLHSLFSQCSMTATDTEVRRTYAAQADACHGNVERILASLPLHLPTTVDCVLALTMATEYCIAQCKATTAWTYVSIASRMSQALGLHRIASQAESVFSVESRQKSKLFWSLYMLEKNLSLQLGRSSTLRDHDITVSLRSVRFGSQGGTSLGILAPQWLQLAQIEGRVYDELYSPQALCQDPGMRESRARNLASEVQRITEDLDPLDRNFLRERRHSLGNSMDDVLIRCDRLSRLSTICLIYRSTSVDRSTFSDECISTARQAIREFSENMTLIDKSHVYLLDVCINWGLLSSTCVPFFVILCHAIWTLDVSDLGLLGSMIDSMEAGQNQLCISAAHLLKTFKPLHGAASRYISLKTDAASESMADSVSFQAIYGEMAPDMTLDMFPMQWSSHSALMSLDQMVPFPMGGDPSGSAGMQHSYDDGSSSHY